ncbi:MULTISPECIES: 16S rRNA (uracil(1498)-N(3))-methyltransferase [unclassified Actinobaculum]|uniref:16S rRNA (uracil(1498)-N(3))-methyltransferase n=1 Tax=unclassified Actinobaculum TaxID=2609299 RepID=UPI000D52645E|nr:MULTISPECIES: 16S rRNA (uracil(1498)-N(3))-methyltransferase [unclassified Actinobaculum]AWE42296.1 16S rRNA (uracil(1498)-N(3))-methyltransferase [Actinobaculum sp. 313]RTE50865.1 16S rRNA (uracil(1498)-N(3))-methyltransferase [Actinobaculum sp. 352]
MTAPVYIREELAALQPGDRICLDGEEGRHAATVRRTRSAERLDLVDGRGTRARCVVVAVSKQLQLEVEEVAAEPAPAPEITLVQALAKGGRDEQAVETCTEYGVAHVVPWYAERCIASWRGKEAKGRERWQATARAAMKQSRRSWLPDVAPVHTTAQLTAQVENAVARGALVLTCHEEASDSATAVLRRWAASTGRSARHPHPADAGGDAAETCGRGQAEASAAAYRCLRNEAACGADGDGAVWFLVGPEGGLTAPEVSALQSAGAQTVLLSGSVLRSASAGAYAIALLHGVLAEYDSR